jgi:RsiW-degrading membrane proteinase PrsW (M82 family)
MTERTSPSSGPAARVRSGIWRTLFLQVAGLLVFVGLVYAAERFIQPTFTPATLLLTSAVLALVPAGIWLTFFYQQDRLEPEPKHFVLGVFALGALLAAAVGIPLEEYVFRPAQWMYADTLTTILGSILVVGFVEEFLKYAAVRYSVYHSAEFDEATDGVIYATAAGLGYATVLNIHFAVTNGGVGLGAGEVRMVVEALAQASFAGITGYFLGRAKFESEPVWWMPLGISLAAVTNGLFNWLRGQITAGGVSLAGSASNPWLGLVLAAGLAVLITVVVSWLISHTIRTAQR